MYYNDLPQMIHNETYFIDIRIQGTSEVITGYYFIGTYFKYDHELELYYFKDLSLISALNQVRQQFGDKIMKFSLKSVRFEALGF